MIFVVGYGWSNVLNWDEKYKLADLERRKKNKCTLPFRTEFTGIFIQTDHLHFVVVFFDETAQCQTKSFVGPNTPVHRVQWPWCQIFVDFLSFTCT